jgi:hypothetical protein
MRMVSSNYNFRPQTDYPDCGFCGFAQFVSQFHGIDVKIFEVSDNGSEIYSFFCHYTPNICNRKVKIVRSYDMAPPITWSDISLFQWIRLRYKGNSKEIRQTTITGNVSGPFRSHHK